MTRMKMRKRSSFWRNEVALYFTLPGTPGTLSAISTSWTRSHFTNWFCSIHGVLRLFVIHSERRTAGWGSARAVEAVQGETTKIPRMTADEK